MEELLQISKMFTHEYIEEHLTKWFGEDTTFLRFERGEGAAKGDSYLSDIYRITFYGRTKNSNRDVNLRVIIKTFPANIGRMKSFRSSDFFYNEISFYEEVLPVLLDFQSKKTMPAPFEGTPRVFASLTNGVDDFLIVEDLSVFNYRVAVRQEGSDLNHMKIILECFAKFHALSFAFGDQHPEKYNELKKKAVEPYYFEDNWNWYKKLWESLCACAIDAVSKEYPGTIYEEKIKEFATPKTFYKCCKLANENGNTAVFGHGDSWIANFLVKYKPGSDIPESVKMIDFQLRRCASPILDISFFIYACSTQELREKHYEDLLKYYYQCLSSQIKDLGTDPDKVYSWELFRKEVKDNSFLGLAFSFESIPASILEPEDAFDMDRVQGDDAYDISEVWIINPIKTKTGRLRLANNIVHAVDNGFI